MKILVCADSHGDYPRLFRAHEAAGAVDLVIHLGDGAEDAHLLETVLDLTVLRVAGNCDHSSTLPKELFLDLEGESVFLTHGHVYGVKGGLAPLVARGAAIGASLVLYGHTHRASLERVDGLVLLNPGPLAGAGSFALLTVSRGTPPAVEFLTLPPLPGGA